MMATYWRAFFAYARQVTRIQAEEDLRQLYLLRASQAEEKGFRRMVRDLRKQMGDETPDKRERPRGDTAERLLRETRGQRFIDGSVQVVDGLQAELEAKRRKFEGGQ